LLNYIKWPGSFLCLSYRAQINQVGPELLALSCCYCLAGISLGLE
jgi:hypothetical protein